MFDSAVLYLIKSNLLSLERRQNMRAKLLHRSVLSGLLVMLYLASICHDSHAAEYIYVLTSTPPGADIYITLSGKQKLYLGKTPFHKIGGMDLNWSGGHLILHKLGYVRKKVVLHQAIMPGKPYTVHVELEQTPKAIPRMHLITSSPPNARIYLGPNANKMKYVGETNYYKKGVTPGKWLSEYFQARKKGYDNSPLKKAIDPGAGKPLILHFALKPIKTGQNRLKPSQLVADIQKELIKYSYDIPASDGRLDEKTFMAIRHYQRDENLIPSGKPSIALLKHLRSSPLDDKSKLSLTLPKHDPHERFRQAAKAKFTRQNSERQKWYAKMRGLFKAPRHEQIRHAREKAYGSKMISVDRARREGIPSPPINIIAGKKMVHKMTHVGLGTESTTLNTITSIDPEKLKVHALLRWLKATRNGKPANYDDTDYNYSLRGDLRDEEISNTISHEKVGGMWPVGVARVGQKWSIYQRHVTKGATSKEKMESISIHKIRLVDFVKYKGHNCARLEQEQILTIYEIKGNQRKLFSKLYSTYITYYDYNLGEPIYVKSRTINKLRNEDVGATIQEALKIEFPHN
jgi:hypothetical protein